MPPPIPPPPIQLPGFTQPVVSSNSGSEGLAPPELFLTDDGNIYWWAVGDPYQMGPSGNSGYFVNVVDATDLPPLPPLVSHPLSPNGGPVGARLSAPNAPYGFPTESLLHLVDPAGIADFLLHGQDGGQMVTKSSVLAGVVGGFFTDTDHGCSFISGSKLPPDIALPPAFGMIAPLSAPLISQSASTIVDNLDYSTFYGDVPPPTLDEINAIELHAPGVCSREIPFTPLYNGTATTAGLQEILSGTINNLCSHAAIDGAAINYLFGTPVIGRDDETNLPIPKFFLNADLSMHMLLQALGIGFGCSLRASAMYDLVVTDGRLKFEISKDNTDVRIDAYSGGGCENISFPTILLNLSVSSALPLTSYFLELIQQAGGVWANISGPNTLIRDVLLKLFLRQEINQIIRAQTGIPIGDYGNYLTNLLAGPLAAAGFTTFPFNATCDPTQPNDGEFVENGSGDAPGDRHIVPTSFPVPIQIMCRLIREGFMQTHKPNGPPMTLSQFIKQPFGTQDPCTTLVTDPEAWSHFQSTSGPQVANTDEQALQLMFDAIRETAADGTLRHWACPTPCDPSENQQMSFDIAVDENLVVHLTIEPDEEATFNSCVGASGGCKSTLSSVLGGPSGAASTFGRFKGCGAGGKPNDSPADPHHSLVTFYPPVRRIILKPDAIEVIFVDNENDWTNAALAARYALAGVDAASASTGIKPFPKTNLVSDVSDNSTGLVQTLCGYKRPSDTFMRPWATLRYPQNILDDIISCGQPNRACVTDTLNESPTPPPQSSGCKPLGSDCEHDTACCSGSCYPHDIAGKCVLRGIPPQPKKWLG